MLFTFMAKQTSKRKKTKLIETMIASLNISPDQKKLYTQALGVLSKEEWEKLFDNLTKFIEKIELKEIEEIKKESFISVSGMRKKEAEEKAQEMNSFSFLLHNL